MRQCKLTKLMLRSQYQKDGADDTVVRSKASINPRSGDSDPVRPFPRMQILCNRGVANH